MAIDQRVRWILKAAAAIILAAAVILSGYGIFRLLDASGALLPSWTKEQETPLFREREIQDGLTLRLKGKRVTIFRGDERIWRSPAGVLVQDLLYEDVDRDGQKEVILLCWRRGSYGDHMPFWVKENDRDWGQHVFIYDYIPDSAIYEPIHPIWMSSTVHRDMTDLSWDPDRRAIYLTETNGRTTGWAWISWGLDLVSESSEVSFLCTGDLMAHRSIYTYGLANGNGFGFLFERTEGLPDRIKRANVSVLALETPLVDDPALYGDFPEFGAPEAMGQAAVEAGFDVVTCANNHALDRGMRGIDTTTNLFSSAGVLCLGVQDSNSQDALRPYQVIERQGIRFALFDLTYGLNGRPLPGSAPYAVHVLPAWDDEDGLHHLKNNLREAREGTDCVIVFVHWGTEYASSPDEDQLAWKDLFLEEGVDIVVGTHPHVVQPMEVFTSDSGHEMLVCWSLGNLISGSQDSETNSGAVAVFTVKKTGDGIAVTDPELIPIDPVFGSSLGD